MSTVVKAGLLPANILRLFEAVDSERCERDRKAKVHQAAKAAVQEASQEMARLQGRFSEEEREIAMSGGPIPQLSALDEPLAQASRKKRILLIREKAASEEVSACEARIQPIIAEIRTAWAEYGKQVYRERLAAFGAAAMELVDRWLDMAALVNAFPHKRESISPNPFMLPQVMIEDQTNRSVFIGTTDPVWTAKLEALRGRNNLNVALRGAMAEIESHL